MSTSSADCRTRPSAVPPAAGILGETAGRVAGHPRRPAPAWRRALPRALRAGAIEVRQIGGEAMIEVRRTDDGDPFGFEVAVSDGAGETRHRVTMSRDQHERLTGGQHAPDATIEAVFRFLLDREPKESIMARFDVGIVSRYFPEFEDKLPAYLGRA